MQRRAVLSGTFAAVVLVAASGLGAGALTGTFAEIDPAIPDGFVSGDDINDAGQSTGRAEFVVGVNSAFLREPDGTYTELVPLAGDPFSQGSAINVEGDVVGGSGVHATLWEAGGAPVDLGFLPGSTTSFALDINDDGWIVGTTSDTSQSWYRDPDVGTLVDMGNVPGGTFPQVRAINNDEVAVGRVLVGGEWQPFTWTEAGGMVLFSVPDGEVDFEPLDINGAGQIVGISTEFIAPEVVYRGYLLDPVDGYIPLLMNGYESTFPRGMNDSGLVVGFVDNTGSSSRVPAAWDTATGDATAFPLFVAAGFSNELNAVNNSGIALGYSIEGDEFERTFIGPIAPDPVPVAPTAPPAEPAPVAPSFTG